MEKDTLKHNPWDDYLIVGVLVAIMLTILDYSKDSFYQVVPAVVMIAVTGLGNNLKILICFVRKYWPVFILAVMHVVYFLFVSRSADSIKFIVATLFVTFSGYCLVMRSKGHVERAYLNLWTLMFVLILLGISKMIKDDQVWYSFNYTFGLVTVILFFGITAFYQENIRLKTTGVVMTFLSLLLIIKSKAYNLENILAIKSGFAEYLNGEFKELILGRGQLSASTVVENYPKNTLSIVLYDYGLMMLALYLLAFILAVVLIKKSKDILLIRQAVLVCLMILVCFLFPLQYWGTILFLLWTGIGIMLGRLEYAAEKECQKSKELV